MPIAKKFGKQNKRETETEREREREREAKESNKNTNGDRKEPKWREVSRVN